MPQKWCWSEDSQSDLAVLVLLAAAVLRQLLADLLHCITYHDNEPSMTRATVRQQWSERERDDKSETTVITTRVIQQ